METKSKIKKVESKIDSKQQILNLLKDLDEGNLAPVRNYLKSLLPKIVPVNYNNKVDEFRVNLIKNKTNAERVTQVALRELNIKCNFQHIVKCKPGVSYILDFYLPSKKICIEVDGGYHFTKEQQIKDKFRTKDLREQGIRVIRFKNEEVFRRDFKELLKYKLR